ncbi:MAG TPA: Xaa-Pro peptidase family protein [Acidobacteriaceae bacterium]
MRSLRYLAATGVLVLTLGAHALERQPAAAYHARRVALAEKLQGGVAVLFANEEPALEYQDWRQDEDFYYLTGWNEPGAALVVEAPLAATAGHAARPYREVLMLPSRNLRMELYTGVKLDAATAGAAHKAGVDRVGPLAELTAELNTRFAEDRHTLLWGEASSEATAALATLTASSIGSAKAPSLLDVSAPIQELRSVKDAGEIALLRKASDASVQAQFAMMRSIHPGQKERVVEGILYATLLANGCERPSYPSIVGSGINSTELHYSADEDTMQAGDVVVVDAAGEYSMYASDITRTLPVSGHFTPRQREIYDIVLGAQKAAMDAFVAGKSRIGDSYHEDPNSLDTIAWKYMNAHGKDLHGEGLGRYFIHGIGHGVGIDVHDPFDRSKPIERGQVFTIEPGIYIPEEKIGVRIEDVFYASPDGKLIDLTEALPKTADAVEAVVQGK